MQWTIRNQTTQIKKKKKKKGKDITRHLTKIYRGQISMWKDTEHHFH